MRIFWISLLCVITILIALHLSILICDILTHGWGGRLKPKHEHTWETLGASYQSQDPNLTRFRSPDRVSMEHVLYGVTTLTQKCTGCGFTRSTTHTGKLMMDGWVWDK